MPIMERSSLESYTYLIYTYHSMATVDDKKIIFSMVGLNKTIQQNNKQVLKNIYLSFFYGAKIGIIGLNGSGKSTLLKIIRAKWCSHPDIPSGIWHRSPIWILPKL